MLFMSVFLSDRYILQSYIKKNSLLKSFSREFFVCITVSGGVPDDVQADGDYKPERV